MRVVAQSGWTMAMVAEATPTPFATVEITLPTGLTGEKANGVTSFTVSEDGMKVRLLC
jgi:hypothetical protein